METWVVGIGTGWLGKDGFFTKTKASRYVFTVRRKAYEAATAEHMGRVVRLKRKSPPPHFPLMGETVTVRLTRGDFGAPPARAPVPLGRVLSFTAPSGSIVWLLPEDLL